MTSSRTLQVVEYAHLTTDATAQESATLGVVSEATFEWLVKISQQEKHPEKVLEVAGDRRIRLGSMVGYLESPDGTGIEVLPKLNYEAESPQKMRGILQKILTRTISVSKKEYHSATLKTLNLPIHEWIFSLFLNELKRLLDRGLSFDYECIQANERFIRGQLNIVKQMRQRPGQATHFNLSYDVFNPNRLENRLIKTALHYVLNACRDAENWRSANEFHGYLEGVSELSNPTHLFDNWETSKALKHYEAIQPWCELILKNLNPSFQKGSKKGISLMFPMERLFESYVSQVLSRSLSRGAELRFQVSRLSLVEHTPSESENTQHWFRLKPDLILQTSEGYSVIDLKWKLLNQNKDSASDKYQISQSDMVQLFAYGQKYQQGHGDMMLVYPKHRQFDKPLEPFKFNNELRLWAVPFCLEKDQLVEGNWAEFIKGITAPK